MSAAQKEINSIVERMFLGRLLQLMRQPIRMSTKDYAESHRWLSSEVSAKPGFMDCMETPFMLYVMQCLDDPEIPVIVGRKSAQIAWTETINSYIQRRIHTDPQNIIISFPRQASAKSYANEKFRPLVRNSKELLELIGNPDNCPFDFYKFPGGFLKLVTAGSPTALKSTSAPILIVEEPDDLKEDVKGQGDALAIFTERQKTYAERKLIYAGTPTEEGFSKVELAYAKSNRLIYLVPCRKCKKFHELDFDNLKYDPYPGNGMDKTYGKYNPETAYYECPFCQAIWDDADKKKAVEEALNYHRLGWNPTASSSIYGFSFNELMSSFAGSKHVDLARKKLEAEMELSKGKEGKMKAFVNNSRGRAYSPKSTSIDVDTLKAKRVFYNELVVPVGGVVLTCGIDVQHNRFAIIIRAWGRNGNSWLVYWGELFGNVLNPEDPVWEALTNFIFTPIPYAEQYEGRVIELPISAGSIDSGDGKTAGLVYNWVKQVNKRNPYFFATKGDHSVGKTANEIFTIPSSPDMKTSVQERKTLAETMGILVYFVGVQRAKDEIYRKLSLTGEKDRMFHYIDVRDDYEEQILSNIKKLSPSGNEVRYELIVGRRDEALDCEVLAEHAKRGMFIHVWTPKHWQQAEQLLIDAVLQKPAPNQEMPEEEENVFPGIN
jgi:phage terminase large subunit GpA-like protein